MKLEWDEGAWLQCRGQIEMAIRNHHPRAAHAAIDDFIQKCKPVQVTLDCPIAMLASIGEPSFGTALINALESFGARTFREAFRLSRDQIAEAFRDARKGPENVELFLKYGRQIWAGTLFTTPKVAIEGDYNHRGSESKLPPISPELKQRIANLMPSKDSAPILRKIARMQRVDIFDAIEAGDISIKQAAVMVGLLKDPGRSEKTKKTMLVRSN